MANQFTQEEQTAIVKMARDLTAAIEFEEDELEKLKHENFKKLPAPPTREVIRSEAKIQPEYPADPVPTYTYLQHLQKMVHINNQILFWLAFAAVFVVLSGVVLVFLVVAYFSYKKELQVLSEEMKKYEPYFSLAKEAERIADEKNAVLEQKRQEKQKICDEKYEKAKENYDSVVLPQYNKEKEIWQQNQRKKIDILKEEITLNKEMLDHLYEKTRLISTTYKQLWILSWLFEDMNSSDHDVRYATELLDRDRQRLATEESGRLVQASIRNMEGSMLRGMKDIFDSIEYGNSLQEESIAQLSKLRRDTNIGNLIGTVQRHNTNKMIEKMLK